MKKLITFTFMFAVAATLMNLMVGCTGSEGPLVITKKVFYPDPILEYDFSPRPRNIPPRYSPEGVVNPFMTAKDHRDAAIRTAKISNKVVIDVPMTTLTSATMAELNLTSVVVNHTFAYAFFTVGGSDKCYKATVGDFIGKKGLTITGITPGVVHMSDGDTLALNR